MTLDQVYATEESDDYLGAHSHSMPRRARREQIVRTGNSLGAATSMQVDAGGKLKLIRDEHDQSTVKPSASVASDASPYMAGNALPRLVDARQPSSSSFHDALGVHSPARLVDPLPSQPITTRSSSLLANSLLRVDELADEEEDLDSDELMYSEMTQSWWSRRRSPPRRRRRLPPPRRRRLPGPVHCEWNLWDGWTPCTKTCSKGTQKRKREKKRVAQHGGQACKGAAKEDRPCNTKLCPVLTTSTTTTTSTGENATGNSSNSTKSGAACSKSSAMTVLLVSLSGSFTLVLFSGAL